MIDLKDPQARLEALLKLLVIEVHEAHISLLTHGIAVAPADDVGEGLVERNRAKLGQMGDILGDCLEALNAGAHAQSKESGAAAGAAFENAFNRFKN